MSTMTLSSSTPLDTADPRLRSTISVLNDQSVYFIGSPSNWSGLPKTRVSTTPARTRCPVVPVMLCTCRARLSFLCEYRHRRLLLLRTCVQLLDGCRRLFPFLWSQHGCSRTRCHPVCVFASSTRARSELRPQQQTCYHVSS